MTTSRLSIATKVITEMKKDTEAKRYTHFLDLLTGSAFDRSIYLTKFAKVGPIIDGIISSFPISESGESALLQNLFFKELIADLTLIQFGVGEEERSKLALMKLVEAECNDDIYVLNLDLVIKKSSEKVEHTATLLLIGDLKDSLINESPNMLTTMDQNILILDPIFNFVCQPAEYLNLYTANIKKHLPVKVEDIQYKTINPTLHFPATEASKLRSLKNDIYRLVELIKQKCIQEQKALSHKLTEDLKKTPLQIISIDTIKKTLQPYDLASQQILKNLGLILEKTNNEKLKSELENIELEFMAYKERATQFLIKSLEIIHHEEKMLNPVVAFKKHFSKFKKNMFKLSDEELQNYFSKVNQLKQLDIICLVNMGNELAKKVTIFNKKAVARQEPSTQLEISITIFEKEKEKFELSYKSYLKKIEELKKLVKQVNSMHSKMGKTLFQISAIKSLKSDFKYRNHYEMTDLSDPYNMFSHVLHCKKASEVNYQAIQACNEKIEIYLREADEAIKKFAGHIQNLETKTMEVGLQQEQKKQAEKPSSVTLFKPLTAAAKQIKATHKTEKATVFKAHK